MIIINQTQKEELGGFKSIEIILLKNVLFCPYILTNTNALDFSYDKFLEEDISILPVNESIYMRSRPKRTANGMLYKLDAGFLVDYIDTNLETILKEQYQLQPVIVKGYTNSNKVVIYGSQLQPITFYYELDQSTSIESKSKIKINCTAEISQKPVIATV